MNEDNNENDTILEIYSPKKREELKECDDEMTSLQQQPANYSFCDRLRRKLSLKNGLLMTATAAFIGGCVYANNQMIVIDEKESSSRQLQMSLGMRGIKLPIGYPWARGRWVKGNTDESCASACARTKSRWRKRPLVCLDDKDGGYNYNPMWPGHAVQIAAMRKNFGCHVFMLPGDPKIGQYQDNNNHGICYLWPNALGSGYARPGQCGARYIDANRLCWCWNIHRPPTPKPTLPPVPPTQPPVPAKLVHATIPKHLAGGGGIKGFLQRHSIIKGPHVDVIADERLVKK